MQVRTMAVAMGLGLALVAGSAACSSDDDASPGTSGIQTTASPDRTTAPDPDATGSTTVPAAPVSVKGVEVLVAAQPLVLVPRPGDDHLWMGERAGRVRRVAVSADGRTLDPDDEPVLDLSADTSTDGERGLLGLAFSPDGSTLLVSHSNADGDTRLVSYRVEGDSVVAASANVLLAVDQPFPNHNGGHVAWGPDGKVWFGLGDGGSQDDPDNRAQDPDDLLGKIVRLDPDGGGEPDIVVSGLRNPWRFAFDTDASLWIADVGANNIEEIDHLPAGSIEGANLGWSGYEGSEPYQDEPDRRPADPVMPVFEYTHDSGNCSVIGGFPYRGTALAGLDGAFLFADLCAGSVRAVRLDADGRFAEEVDLGVDVANPVSFGTDADGEPFVLSSNGTVVRLVPAG